MYTESHYSFLLHRIRISTNVRPHQPCCGDQEEGNTTSSGTGGSSQRLALDIDPPWLGASIISGSLASLPHQSQSSALDLYLVSVCGVKLQKMRSLEDTHEASHLAALSSCNGGSHLLVTVSGNSSSPTSP